MYFAGPTVHFIFFRSYFLQNEQKRHSPIPRVQNDSSEQN